MTHFDRLINIKLSFFFYIFHIITCASLLDHTFSCSVIYGFSYEFLRFTQIRKTYTRIYELVTFHELFKSRQATCYSQFITDYYELLTYYDVFTVIIVIFIYSPCDSFFAS